MLPKSMVEDARATPKVSRKINFAFSRTANGISSEIETGHKGCQQLRITFHPIALAFRAHFTLSTTSKFDQFLSRSRLATKPLKTTIDNIIGGAFL